MQPTIAHTTIDRTPYSDQCFALSKSHSVVLTFSVRFYSLECRYPCGCGVLEIIRCTVSINQGTRAGNALSYSSRKRPVVLTP